MEVQAAKRAGELTALSVVSVEGVYYYCGELTASSGVSVGQCSLCSTGK
jgi:hypothetical protein